ncbi:MAG: 1-acyl-sn-glycerol-3-phosphate acyltransferase [Turicibacter sp.]|nr:1-acyl-sn-glycerol-3-phosphate acyltransferase [Turicibacter sp.]
MIIRSIYWYFCFAFSLIAQTPRLFIARSKAKKMEQKEFSAYVHGVASKWARGNALRSGAKFNFEGLENIPADEAVLFVSNHQGDFDIAVFLAFLSKPHGYVSKFEILKVPLLRDWMKLMRCIFIDRSNIRQTAGAFVEGVKILKSGHSIVLFPEGTRSKSDKMGEFKAASFKLATKANVPIVPITINGTYKIMEANRKMIKPADVSVKIHAPIRLETVEDLTKLPDQVKTIIESGLEK